jgi:hypothetical protein
MPFSSDLYYRVSYRNYNNQNKHLYSCMLLFVTCYYGGDIREEEMSEAKRTNEANVCKFTTGKPKGTTPLLRRRSRWEICPCPCHEATYGNRSVALFIRNVSRKRWRVVTSRCYSSGERTAITPWLCE